MAMAEGGAPADSEAGRRSGDPPRDDVAEPATGSVGDAEGQPAEATSRNPPAVPLLHLDGFDGPMDLLLDLAERRLVDWGRVSIVGLARQFVAELEGRLRRVAIERRADWLVVAARLMQLRSRLLLPANPAAAAEAARDAARVLAGLEEMRLLRAAMAWLDARAQLGRDVFVRPHGRNPRVASYMALMEACLTLIQGRPGGPGADEEVHRIVVGDFWRVGDALARIRARLGDVPQASEMLGFVPKLPGEPDRPLPDRPLKVRAAVASTLLACLELARDGELRLDQRDHWGAIGVSRGDAAIASDQTTMGSPSAESPAQRPR